MAHPDYIEDPVLRGRLLGEYPHDWTYHDWTLTILETSPETDLEKAPEWQTALQSLSEISCAEVILWIRDLENTHHVLVLGDFLNLLVAETDALTYLRSENTYDDAEDLQYSPWTALKAFLLSPPSAQHLVHNSNDYCKSYYKLHELIIVEASCDLLTHLYLNNVDILKGNTTPAIGHDMPVEFVGCARGITGTSDAGRRTLAIICTWVGTQERNRLIDPNQHSYGGASQYEDVLASALRDLKAKGASVNNYLLNLRRWCSSISIDQ